MAIEEVKGTKFTWKIENFSCWKGGTLVSPTFGSHSTTWEVSIFSSENNWRNSFELRQVKRVAESFNLSLALLDHEGSPLIWRQKNNFDSYSFLGDLPSIVIRKNKFAPIKDKLLLNDILTVECRIWQTDHELIHANSCFALTRIENMQELIEEMFTLQITEVSSLQPIHIKECVHKITRHGITVKTRLFFNRDKELQTEITLSLVRICAKCKISLLDPTRKHIQVADGNFNFDAKGKVWKLNTQITRDLLTCNQDKLLLNDSLTLVFEFTFTRKVSVHRIVEENEFRFNNPQPHMHDPSLASSEPENKKLNENSNNLKPSNTSDPPVTINQVLQNMYEEGLMSDFTLRVENRTFPVHKNILGARSSVFMAMFTVDMKEKESGSVDIPDVDADTIQRMLKFIYCDSVQEDMQWESASSLYAAADKYALEPLKQRCSDILKSKLCAASVPGVLLLAATYQDHDLGTAVVEFIERNDKLIIGTEPWCKFEKDNPQIALDVFRMLYVRKMNG